MEETIEFSSFLKVLKKGMNFILIMMIVCIGIMTLLNAFIITPVYSSTTQILVNQTTTSGEEMDTTDIQTNIQLIETYSVIIESPAVLDEVVKRLSGDVSVKELQDAITVTSQEGTQVMNITVEGENPENTAIVANTVAEVFKAEIVDIMQVENVTILSPASVGEKVKPGGIKSTIFATGVGLVLGVAIVFIRELLDTTIKTEETITELLDLPVLGTISDFDSQE